MTCTPMLYVKSVRSSSAWYCALLAARHDHDSDDFDRVLDGDAVYLMLHAHDTHGHGAVDLDIPPGGGVQLWFVVEDVYAVHARAVELSAHRLTAPEYSPIAHWTEFTLRDPDGYSVAVAQWGDVVEANRTNV